MICIMISKLLGVFIFLNINHSKQLLMDSYLMKITTILTINKKVYSSKRLYNSTFTTHVQEIHCDLKCSSNVFNSVCKLFLLYLYFVSFNAKYLYIFILFDLQFYFILHTLFGAIRKKYLSLRHKPNQAHHFEVRSQISNSNSRFVINFEKV